MGPAWFGTVGDLAADLEALTAATATIDGLHVGAVLHHTDKSLVTDGTYRGEAVVIKLLTARPRDGGPDWAVRHRHEQQVLAAAAIEPPAARVPELMISGTGPVTVTRRLSGARVGEHRYAEHVDSPTAEAICDALTAFASWPATPAARREWWDYPARIEQASAEGILTPPDRRAALRLLAAVGSPRVVQHGDPLPTNLLLDHGRVGLVDLEFVGCYVQGLDLALIDVLIGSGSPAVRATINTRVARDGAGTGYALNLVVLVAREISLHRHLPDLAVRAARHGLLAVELDRARHVLHDADRSTGAST
ncbi:hypothetical protein Lfu02_01190 [Longispora fulva]|nr:hypothetical protein Lfu02_01190 [Longispora fulva]